VDGLQTLLPGRISHQEAYRNPETGEWEKPSPELKVWYRQAVATIKKLCVRYQYKPDTEMFIGPEALELLRSGKVKIIDAQVVAGGRG
jgi:hypothetical protein